MPGRALDECSCCVNGDRFWTEATPHGAVNVTPCADFLTAGPEVSVGPTIEVCHKPLTAVPLKRYSLAMSPNAVIGEIPLPIERSVFGRTSVEHIDSKSILTRASGFLSRYDFTLNPYSGCGFGCEYCYARFFAPSARQRETWGKWVSVKRNGRELMTTACRSGALKTGDAIYMSSVTDPYQPVEQRLGLTRAILEAMLECGVQPRLTIQTRSPIVTRDIDLLRRFDKVRVNFSIPTDSEAVRLRYEPHAPFLT